MQPLRFRDDDVFLYRSWLFSESPILHDIYCESHRFEPWAVDGSPLRAGRYTSPGVLAVAHAERAELLARIPERLIESARTVDEWEARFRHAVRALMVRRRALRDQPLDVGALDRVLESAARVLSVGVLKEKLEPEDARALLVRFVPDRVLRAHLLELYQPLCLPHFVKLEAALLFVAARFARARTPAKRRAVVRAAIERHAHHARFLLEETELAAASAMRDHIEGAMNEHGASARALRDARARVLAANAARRADALRAARAIKRALVDAGEPTARARATLAGIVRAIQFVATWEELKHILVMDAARDVRRVLDRVGLPARGTSSDELRAAMRARLLRLRRR
jgi:hypothetical protein